MDLENVIDFLALKGVKSFHIEFYEKTLTEEQHKKLSDGFVPAGKAKHDIPVHQERAAELEPEPAGPAKVLPVKTETTKPIEEPKQLPAEEPSPVIEQPKPKEEPKKLKERKKIEEPVKKEQPVEKREEKSAERPSSTIADKDVYQAFVRSVEHDDGTFGDLRRELIARMTLDDMLRINNDFQLGLDTDRPTEDIRAELVTCF